jgi:hypothetical protein
MTEEEAGIESTHLSIGTILAASVDALLDPLVVNMRGYVPMLGRDDSELDLV